MKTRIFLLFFCLFVIATVAHGKAALQSGIIKGEGVNLRAEPDLDGRIISVLKQGIPVAIMEETDLWVKAQLPDGQTGWVYRQFVELKALTPVTSGERLIGLPVDEMIAFAQKLLGISYVYGGSSPRGFDCSGFTMYVFAKFGIRLPHQSERQMESGMEIPAREELLPGDLVFFKTMGSKTVNHVGIYLGDNRFIHASSGYGAVRISPIDSGYYYKCYVGGRRLLNNDTGEISIS